MASNKLRLAILSDLHCHPEKPEFKDNNTHLFSAKLRSPVNEHPVEDLLELISKKTIEVDLVLSPGDITDHCDKQGLFSGWSYVTEISRALKARGTIATIGNHDVDSRLNYSNHSFDIIKRIKQDFPIAKQHIGTFWDKGFTFIEEPDLQILVLNSTHFHTHSAAGTKVENPAIKGKVDSIQIEEIKQYLEDNNNPEKVKIFLCHHHPLQHSRLQLGEHDFIENGADLINLLGEYKFDLAIHGHKHDPWLRYENTSSGHQIPILSSGSFSATNQTLYAGIWNYFHLVEVSKDGNLPAHGKVETFTYKPKSGWKNDSAEGFLPYTGFGFLGDLVSIVMKIEETLKGRQVVEWNEILDAAPEILNLTPDKMTALENMLQQKKINVNSKIGVGPKHIYHANN